MLLVDDEPDVIVALEEALRARGFGLHVARDLASLRAHLRAEPDVVLLDPRVVAEPAMSEPAACGPEPSGSSLVRELRAQSPDSEVIVMTRGASVDAAVSCMRAGAYDYLEKPGCDAGRILETVVAALARRSLRLSAHPAPPRAPGALAQIVARSPAMKRVVRTIRDLAHSNSTVLIEAPSGAGKELVARAIHETSRRAQGTFVPVDCGALPEGIAEGELFGFERGAFTGAHRASAGLFRSADGGTLFLDEVGELPLALQAKLLRAIQQREVRPLGGSHPLPVDVRIIAATNRDLGQEVREARFRADLFYRLRVVSLSIPPLRERPEDIPALVSRFLARRTRESRIRGLEPDVLEALVAHPWEGNVRELENAIEAALALGPGPTLTLGDLRLGSAAAGSAPVPAGIPLALEAWEAACLREVLQRAEGDVTRAAQLLGIGRSTLYRKMARHGLVRA